MKMTAQEYARRVRRTGPHSPLLADIAWAFCVGGGICLLGEWQKMGGKVIITSDSHDINSLTYGFDEAAAAIKAAGFTSVQVLTGSGFETQEL